MNEEVVKRNFEAVNQFMKDMRAENAKLYEEINSFRGTLSTQQAEIQQLRQQVGVLQARLMGGGPTSGN